MEGELKAKMEAQIRAEVAAEKEKVRAAGGLYCDRHRAP
jgi:hypothetical protein